MFGSGRLSWVHQAISLRVRELRAAVRPGWENLHRTDHCYPPGILTTLISIAEK